MLNFDNTQAFQEGWAIFNSFGSDNGDWQLQKVDDAEIFGADEDAWDFVCDRAEAGSKYHQAAMEFLKQNNPKEYFTIIVGR